VLFWSSVSFSVSNAYYYYYLSYYDLSRALDLDLDCGVLVVAW